MGTINYVELSRAVLTASLAVVGGIIVLVIGQLIERYIIEPIHEQSRHIGEISFALYYHGDKYIHPDPQRPDSYEVGNHLRGAATRLLCATNTIRGYTVLSLFRVIPSIKHINTAVKHLVNLASMQEKDGNKNEKRREEVVKLLRIKVLCGGGPHYLRLRKGSS